MTLRLSPVEKIIAPFVKKRESKASDQTKEPVNHSRLAIFTLLAAIFGEGALLQLNSSNQQQGFLDLNKDLNQSRARVFMLENNLKAEEEINQGLKSQVAKLKLEQNNTEKRFKGIENTQEDLQARLANMTQRQQTINVLIAATLDTLNESQIAMHDEIQAQFVELNEDQDQIQEDVSGRLDKLEEKQDALLASLESGFQEVKDSQNRLQASLESQISSLSDKLNSKVTFNDVIDVIQKVAPSTASISLKETGLGSAVIIKNKDGRQVILTAAHNLTTSPEMTLLKVEKTHDLMMVIVTNEVSKREFNIELYKGSGPGSFKAKVLKLGKGKFTFTSPVKEDLALLEMSDVIKLPDGIGVTIRDLKNDPLQIGEPVVVIGNAVGLKDSVSFGVVSNPHRAMNGQDDIQINASCSPGNSGSLVTDMQGRLIGIVKWVANLDLDAQGITGVIPADRVLKNLDKWEEIRKKAEEENIAPEEKPEAKVKIN